MPRDSAASRIRPPGGLAGLRRAEHRGPGEVVDHLRAEPPALGSGEGAARPHRPEGRCQSLLELGGCRVEIHAALPKGPRILDQPRGKRAPNAGKIALPTMIRLSRKIHFNAGRSLWRPGWTPERNRAVYGEESPHGYGHNYELELSVVGATDPETGMVVNLTDLDRVLREEVDRPLDHKKPEPGRARVRRRRRRRPRTWLCGSGTGSRRASLPRNGRAASCICACA